MRIRLLVLAVLLCATLTCDADASRCELRRRYSSQFHYDVNADEATATGIQVDRSGQSYPPLEMIDRLMDDVEACLVSKYGDPPVLPEEVMAAYDCTEPRFTFPFNRECLTVKIPDDWFVSMDDTQELLPFAGPFSGCKRKHPDAEKENGCFWRAGLQCSNIIVSTPSLYVFKDPLIRAATNCNNPWGVKIREDGSYDNVGAALPPELRLSECASPDASDVPSRSPLPGKRKPEGFLGYAVDKDRTGCGY